MFREYGKVLILTLPQIGGMVLNTNISIISQSAFPESDIHVIKGRRAKELYHGDL